MRYNSSLESGSADRRNLCLRAPEHPASEHRIALSNLAVTHMRATMPGIASCSRVTSALAHTCSASDVTTNTIPRSSGDLDNAYDAAGTGWDTTRRECRSVPHILGACCRYRFSWAMRCGRYVIEWREFNTEHGLAEEIR